MLIIAAAGRGIGSRVEPHEYNLYSDVCVYVCVFVSQTLCVKQPECMISRETVGFTVLFFYLAICIQV